MRCSGWSVRWTCFLLTAVAVAGCSAAEVAVHPGLSACRSYGLRAIERRVTVRGIPPACAGLSGATVNQAVSSAIHEAVGGLPKAAARRLALADGRYLAPLIQAVRPSPPQAPLSSPAGPASDTAPALAALACWLATAAAGVYLAARIAAARRVRRVRAVVRRLPAVVLAHAGLGLAGLVLWTAFVVAGSAWLAWASAGVIVVIAGLGMATLIGGLPDPRAGQEPAADGSGRRARVLVIAAHGSLATATITLVVLAAIAAT